MRTGGIIVRMSALRTFWPIVFSLCTALCCLAYGQPVSYSDDVHPILAERCYKCHGGEERKGGFSMNTRESFLAGGEFGPAVELGDSSKSLLVAQRIADEMHAVGFDADVEIINRRRFGEDVWFGGDYQMFVGPIAPTTSPNSYLFPIQRLLYP